MPIGQRRATPPLPSLQPSSLNPPFIPTCAFVSHSVNGRRFAAVPSDVAKPAGMVEELDAINAARPLATANIKLSGEALAKSNAIGAAKHSAFISTRAAGGGS